MFTTFSFASIFYSIHYSGSNSFAESFFIKIRES